MSFTRRDLLKDAAIALPFQGLATAGGLDLAHAGTDDVDYLFAKVDAQVAAFREATQPPKARRYLRSKQAPEDTLYRLFEGLLVTGLARDLPPEVQETPKVQRRLRRTLVRQGRAMLGVRQVLRSTTPTERQEMQRKLADDPAFLDTFWSDCEPWFGPGGVPTERKEQLQDAIEQVRWSLVHGDAEAEVDRQVAQIDRAFQVSNRLAHQLGDAPAPGDADMVAALSEEELSDCDAVVQALVDIQAHGLRGGERRERERWAVQRGKAVCGEPADPRFTALRNRITARRLASAGGILAGIGVATIPVTVGLCILTPALILLIVALFFLAAS